MSPFVVNFDPVALDLGFLQLRWYGLMYVVGFVIASYLMSKLIKEGFFPVEASNVDTLILSAGIGMFVGARLVYAAVYNWEAYGDNPLEVFAFWRGGLSFHGAIIGILGASWLFAKRNHLPLLMVTDVLVTVGSIGIFFGRLGNFINGELWGRVSSVPWAMVFPHGGPQPRHPSQLYEAFFEGIVIWSILWFLSKPRVKYYGIQTGLFVLLYGVFRFFIEFFREPDQQLGYFLAGTTTMGQILCLCMVIGGVCFLLLARWKKSAVGHGEETPA